LRNKLPISGKPEIGGGHLRMTAKNVTLLDRFSLGDALHRRGLAREPVERSLVELTLGVWRDA